MIYLNDHIGEINIEEALRQVGPQRAAYALRYRRDLDRRLSLAVFLLLQQALREEYGIREIPQFAYGPNGKPFLKDHPEIHFNLSHCPRAAMCVVSDHPVGCDIEAVPDELDMDLCRYCFNDEEVASILASDAPTLTFTTLWTQKEALLKLTGDTASLFSSSAPPLSRGGGRRPEGFHLSPLTSHLSPPHVSPDHSYVYTVCSAS